MEHKALIDEYEAGGQKLKAAMAGLTKQEMLATPVAGKWSMHQLVIHMQDSDAVAIDRMKRIIAEDKPPLLIGYDENKFVANLFYAEQSAEVAAELFDVSRKQFATVLRRVPDAAWNKFGVHNERGKLTLLEFVQSYVRHLDNHLKHAHEKRAKLGKAI